MKGVCRGCPKEWEPKEACIDTCKKLAAFQAPFGQTMMMPKPEIKSANSGCYKAGEVSGRRRKAQAKARWGKIMAENGHDGPLREFLMNLILEHPNVSAAAEQIGVTYGCLQGVLVRHSVRVKQLKGYKKTPQP